MTKISPEAVLVRILNGEKQQFQFTTYRNAEGKQLTKVERQLLNTGQLTRHYYQNRHQQVKEVRCFPKIDEGNLYEKRLTKLLNHNPFKERKQIQIDCLDNNLEKLYERLFPDSNQPGYDQTKNERIADKVGDDLILVISVIEQCGFPFSKNTVRAAWEVIAAADGTGLVEYYYQQFEEAYEKNLLPTALMSSMKNIIGKEKVFTKMDQGKMKELVESAGFQYDSLTTIFSEHRIIDELAAQSKN